MPISMGIATRHEHNQNHQHDKDNQFPVLYRTLFADGQRAVFSLHSPPDKLKV